MFSKLTSWAASPSGIVTLIVIAIGLANVIIAWGKWTRAQALEQLLARFVLKFPLIGPVLQRFPLLGWMLSLIAGPDDGIDVPVMGKLLSRGDKGGPPAAALVLIGSGLLFGATLLSSCACWQPSNPAYSTPKCVVARAAVQCGSTLASEALAQLLVAAPESQWATLIGQLQGDAGPTVGCLLADLAPSLAAERRKLGLADKDLAAHLLTVARVDGEFGAWKHHHGYDGVRFCYSTSAGQVCR